MIERAAAAHRGGRDSLFVADQHSSPTPFYQDTPMLGRLLAEWGKAPAGCLFRSLVAPGSGGRADRHIGCDRAKSLHHAMRARLGRKSLRMGANIRTRPSAFEEALEIVRRLLTGRQSRDRPCSVTSVDEPA
jgi:hypothetical protein